MREGDRNTKEMGRALCERIAHLESEHHQSPRTPDCMVLYSDKTIHEKSKKYCVNIK